MSGSKAAASNALRAAAAVGHRITHDDDLTEPQEIVQVACDIGAGRTGGQHGRGAKLAASMSAALSHIGASDANAGHRERCPDPCGDIATGSADTLIGIDRRPAALAHDDCQASCEDHEDGPAVQGAAHVWVDGARWVRRGDELDCGARVGEGEPTVLIAAATEQTAERKPALLPGAEPGACAALLSAAGFGGSPGVQAASLGAALAGQAAATHPSVRRGRRTAPPSAVLARALAMGGREALVDSLSGRRS